MESNTSTPKPWNIRFRVEEDPEDDDFAELDDVYGEPPEG